MNRKWIGVLVSLVLAAAGTWVLVQYVNGADERALEGVETVDVLVVSESIPEGSTIDDVSSRVERVSVPADSQAIGSVDTLAGLEGQVTSVALVPGEQIIASRFITPEQLAQAQAREFALPDDLLAVTLSLSPERAVGGALEPGDLVAIVASFEPFDLVSFPVDPGAEGDNVQTPQDLAEELSSDLLDLETPTSSGIILHKAIVLNVQREELPVPADEESAEEQGLELAPTGNLLVTVATESPYVEKIVFGAEWGELWLAAEGELAPDEFDQVQTRSLIYRDILTIENLVTQ